MCYKKPGPRCSAHAAIALDKAAKRYKARPTAKNHAKMMEMRDQYDTTPAGQKMLKDFIKREDIPFDQKLNASLRLTVGELKRRDSYALYQSRFGAKESRKIEKANAERYAQEAEQIRSDFVQRVENSLPEVDTSKPSDYVDAVMRGDSAVVPHSYKKHYTRFELLNDNLSMQDWKPENETHARLMRSALSGVVESHQAAMDEMIETNFDEGLKKGVSEKQEHTLSEYDQGYISAYTGYVQRLKTISVPHATNEEDYLKLERKLATEHFSRMVQKNAESPSEFASGAAEGFESYMGLLRK